MNKRAILHGDEIYSKIPTKSSIIKDLGMLQTNLAKICQISKKKTRNI